MPASLRSDGRPADALGVAHFGFVAFKTAKRWAPLVIAALVAGLLAACEGPGPPVIEPGDPGAADVTLTVRSDQAVHPISPLIYGLNEVGHQAQTNQALSRIGGNRWTAYNWENNASNAGADWCYQNDSYLSPSSVPGAPVQSRLAQAEATHTALIVTVPMVDYVAADKLGGSDPPGCSGDVRKSGSGYLTTRMRRNQPTSAPPLSATPNTTDGNVY
ncbi:MAG: hypothetical protein JWM05_1120, partial [Acidimicrobiales bacterium]|nr:hypothetical protein [Acidimicrobiales bacterium]